MAAVGRLREHRQGRNSNRPTQGFSPPRRSPSWEQVALAHDHRVWIERLSDRLGLSARTTVVLVGTGAVLLHVVSRLIDGPPHELQVTIADFMNFGLLVFVPLAIAVHVPRLMTSLEGHALSMISDSGSVTDKLRALPRLLPVAILALLIFVGLVLPFAIGAPSGEPTVGEILFLAPAALLIWINATALWCLGYSLLAIYRMGRLPLRLTPFALDRTLGLKPFATAALRLTALYYLLSLLVTVPDLLSPGTPVPIVAQDAALLLLGIVLFLLPLLSLRAKLVHARAEKLAWINQRFHRTIQKVESLGEGELPQGLQNELLSIDKIQREIHSIRSWPFDLAVVAKLVTILLSVTAILLATMIRSLLHI